MPAERNEPVKGGVSRRFARGFGFVFRGTASSKVCGQTCQRVVAARATSVRRRRSCRSGGRLVHCCFPALSVSLHSTTDQAQPAPRSGDPASFPSPLSATTPSTLAGRGSYIESISNYIHTHRYTNTGPIPAVDLNGSAKHSIHVECLTLSVALNIGRKALNLSPYIAMLVLVGTTVGLTSARDGRIEGPTVGASRSGESRLTFSYAGSSTPPRADTTHHDTTHHDTNTPRPILSNNTFGSGRLAGWCLERNHRRPGRSVRLSVLHGSRHQERWCCRATSQPERMRGDGLFRHAVPTCFYPG